MWGQTGIQHGKRCRSIGSDHLGKTRFYNCSLSLLNLCLCTPTSIRLHVEHRGSDEIINNEWGIVDTEAPQIGTKNERLRVLATVARLRLELRHVAWKSQLTLAVPTPLPESLRYFSSDPHVVLLLALSILDLRCRLASVKVIARSLFLSLEKNVPLSLSFFLSLSPSPSYQVQRLRQPDGLHRAEHLGPPNTPEEIPRGHLGPFRDSTGPTNFT